MGDERQSVLVVDDDTAVADAYRLLLEEDGNYEVSVANGGPEAMEVVDETFDVILLDRKMPEMPGDEVLRRVRERGYECAVAFVTAAEPFDGDEQLPFDAYLTKPVDKTTLRAAVDRLVSIKGTSREDPADGQQNVPRGGNVVRSESGWEYVS
jgi:CheY-like chemotaxis protein